MAPYRLRSFQVVLPSAFSINDGLETALADTTINGLASTFSLLRAAGRTLAVRLAAAVSSADDGLVNATVTCATPPDPFSCQRSPAAAAASRLLLGGTLIRFTLTQVRHGWREPTRCELRQLPSSRGGARLTSCGERGERLTSCGEKGERLTSCGEKGEQLSHGVRCCGVVAAHGLGGRGASAKQGLCGRLHPAKWVSG